MILPFPGIVPGGGGRYRVISADWWEGSAFLRLPPHARFVLVALMTGSTSAFPGISIVAVEALTRQTGLTAAEIEDALGVLEKNPTPSSSWIVRAAPVIWVRDQLKLDPGIAQNGGSPNEAQRKRIRTYVGSLPSDNPAVKKFKRYYNITLGTVPQTARPTPGAVRGGPADFRGASPPLSRRAPLGRSWMVAGQCFPATPSAESADRSTGDGRVGHARLDRRGRRCPLGGQREDYLGLRW